MDVLIPRCCGVDVHQKTVVASVRIVGPTGEVTRETRTFGTTTRELEGLAAWLRPFAITHLAMEATGVRWKLVWHVLDPAWQLLLVNPRHLKRVPGRKRDVQDAAWIAQLLQCGLRPFPSAPALVSWAGVCPGKRESAGKKRAAGIRKGNRWLTRALGQAAWAARHTKRCYVAAQFRRVARHRGEKRAVIAVANSLLTAIDFIVRDGAEYHDLGPTHFDRFAPEQIARDLVKRLETLGHKVTLEKIAA